MHLVILMYVFLETLANSMSVALENARLFDETNRLLKETEQRTAELAIINSVQEGLASKLDIQAIYDLVGDKIRDVFDTQGISISFYDRETKDFNTHPISFLKGKAAILNQDLKLGGPDITSYKPGSHYSLMRMQQKSLKNLGLCLPLLKLRNNTKIMARCSESQAVR